MACFEWDADQVEGGHAFCYYVFKVLTRVQKEIEVFFHEIYVPILEMKTSTLKQKSVVLGMLQRLCEEPQALVEIYLNYDCDREAVDNIYEQLVDHTYRRNRV